MSVCQITQTFTRRDSTVQIDFCSGLTLELVDKLVRSQLDVVFALMPPPHRLLRTFLVAREPLFVVLPEHHRLATCSALDLGDLAAEQLVLFPRHTHPTLYDRYLQLFTADDVSLRLVDEPTQEGSRLAVAEAWVSRWLPNH